MFDFDFLSEIPMPEISSLVENTGDFGIGNFSELPFLTEDSMNIMNLTPPGFLDPNFTDGFLNDPNFLSNPFSNIIRGLPNGGGSSGGSSGGGRSVLDLLGAGARAIGGGLLGAGGLSGLLSNPALIPSVLQMIQGYKDADQYTDKANEYAEGADPFGKYRGFYGDKLRSLYDDPSSIADTPGYRFALDQGSENLARQLGARGLAHSGKMSTDMMQFSQGLASQTFDQEARRLANLAGAQFGPDTAARLRMQGLDSSVQARNGALASLGYLLGNSGYNGSSPSGLNLGNIFSGLGGTSTGGFDDVTYLPNIIEPSAPMPILGNSSIPPPTVYHPSTVNGGNGP